MHRPPEHERHAHGSVGPSPTQRRLTLAALAVAVLTTVAVLLVVRGAGPGSSGASPSASAGGGRAAVGQAAPDITGTTLDGGAFDLTTLRGRPVIVNFWASWCGPCVHEFPLLRSTLAAHQANGLAIVGVLFKDDAGPAGAFVRQFGASWPTVLDPDGTHATAYTVVAPPQTYFIDAQGVVRYRQIGELLQQDIDAHISSILG